MSPEPQSSITLPLAAVVTLPCSDVWRGLRTGRGSDTGQCAGPEGRRGCFSEPGPALLVS